MAQQGRADWSATAEWDSPLPLWVPPTPNQTGSKLFGPFYVGRWANIVGSIAVQLAAVKVTLFWYADQAGLVPTANRPFVVDPAVNNNLQPWIPNMGPWLYVATDPAGAGTVYSLGGRFFGSNRPHYLDYLPFSQQLFPRQVIPIGPGASVFTPGSHYYSGPARLSLDALTVAGSWAIQQETAPGVWAYTELNTIAAAPAQQEWPILIPEGAWRLQLVNPTGGAINIGATIVSSGTGSL